MRVASFRAQRAPVGDLRRNGDRQPPDGDGPIQGRRDEAKWARDAERRKRDVRDPGADAAVYSGDAGNATSMSSVLTQTVNAAATPPPPPPPSGQPIPALSSGSLLALALLLALVAIAAHRRRR